MLQADTQKWLPCAEIIELRGVFGGIDFRVTYENGDQVEAVISLFEARIVSGDLRPDGQELSELRFASETETVNLPMSKGTRILVKGAFDVSCRFQQPCSA